MSSFADTRSEIGLEEHLTLHFLCRTPDATHLIEFGYPEHFVTEQVGHRLGVDDRDLHLGVQRLQEQDPAGPALSEGLPNRRGGEPIMRTIRMQWNLRQVMADRGMFQTSELMPLLEERGIHLTREHVYRLVTKTPQRLNTGGTRRALRRIGWHPERSHRAGRRRAAGGHAPARTTRAARRSIPSVRFGGDRRPRRRRVNAGRVAVYPMRATDRIKSQLPEERSVRTAVATSLITRPLPRLQPVSPLALPLSDRTCTVDLCRLRRQAARVRL